LGVILGLNEKFSKCKSVRGNVGLRLFSGFYEKQISVKQILVMPNFIISKFWKTDEVSCNILSLIETLGGGGWKREIN
jgi:hypothetical protein